MTSEVADPIALAREVAARIVAIDGVVAVALGGSQARGDARPGSDVDIGIYYRGGDGFDHRALVGLAHELDPRADAMDPTQPGEWGPRINGGAWLQVRGRDVDWLYRDLEHVEDAVARAYRGDVALEHQPGHPAGFDSQIYLAELALGRPVQHPAGALARCASA